MLCIITQAYPKFSANRTIFYVEKNIYFFYCMKTNFSIIAIFVLRINKSILCNIDSLIVWKEYNFNFFANHFFLFEFEFRLNSFEFRRLPGRFSFQIHM